ncbi:MAG TPA: alkaline phosphatase family protein [Candidatus Dormibacteraeota bacterium]|jgi:hypothetical protein|nr:alkaline phosphatase family protein [Candidatus Dormibacteraeota bacterium]
MLRLPVRAISVACALGLAGALSAVATSVPANAGEDSSIRHVLLLSVDGMHQSDLDWYVQKHPGSALASLVGHGTSFTNAQTPVPSDSFPGMVAQVTGGNPKTTGIYYDDSVNHALWPSGTTACTAPAPGAEVTYFEFLDKDPSSLAAGQTGLGPLPDNILKMTGNPQTLLDTTKMPAGGPGCQPIYPHQYIKVNTVFEVIKQAGMRTAWSDKHAAYDVLNGPSGTGIDDLFTPEINSQVPGAPAGKDWTSDNAYTRQYDGYKVQAVINEINGRDHSGVDHVGTPAILGMNFQSVSTGQKLALSKIDGNLAGGYVLDSSGHQVPGTLLSIALDFVNTSVGQMLSALHARHLDKSTAVILSAKHGQSPVDITQLKRIDDGAILDALNAAWAAQQPSRPQPLVPTNPVSGNFWSINDDGMLIWLKDRSQFAADFAKKFLLAQTGTSNEGKAYSASGLSKLYAGDAVGEFFGSKDGDPRVPDIFGIAQQGVVYTGGVKKIAEHGGAHTEDRHVPLVVATAATERSASDGSVETTQIAPTILHLLGLDPQSLQAVRAEHTRTLALGD